MRQSAMRIYKSHYVRRRTPSLRDSLAMAVMPAWLCGFVKKRMGMHKLRGLLSMISTLHLRSPDELRLSRRQFQTQDIGGLI